MRDAAPQRLPQRRLREAWARFSLERPKNTFHGSHTLGCCAVGALSAHQHRGEWHRRFVGEQRASAHQICFQKLTYSYEATKSRGQEQWPMCTLLPLTSENREFN